MSREDSLKKSSPDEYAEDEASDVDLDQDQDQRLDALPVSGDVWGRWMSCPLAPLLRSWLWLPGAALRWLRRLQRWLVRRLEAWMLLDWAVSALLLPLHTMQLVARNSQATAMLWVTLETAVELLAAVVMAGVSIFLASMLLLQDAAEARRKQAELRTLLERETMQEHVAEPVVTESLTPPPTPRL